MDPNKVINDINLQINNFKFKLLWYIDSVCEKTHFPFII